MKVLCLLALFPILASADHGYGYQPQTYCRPTNTSIYAEVCVPGIGTKTDAVQRNIKNVVDDKYCFSSTSTVCEEVTRNVEREICTYTYSSKREQQPATTTQVTYETKSETMKVTSCRASGGYQPQGYGGYGHNSGEHQVCREEYQTQEYRVPLVNTPLEISVEVAAPEPQKVCEIKNIEITETVCNDVEQEKCINLAKLEDAVTNVDQTEAILGEPNCNQITLTLPTEACSEHHGYQG